MADVFISYSQDEPEHTKALAAELKARGYAVWWDTSLLPSDVYWKVLVKKITDADAVIVIWSRPAVGSEWVYAEATLANEQGKRRERKKLICVRTDDVDFLEVPPPFLGMNVEAVDKRDKIFSALEDIGVPRRHAPAAPPPPESEPVAAEPGEIAIAWDTIKGSDDPQDFVDFLAHFGEAHAFFAGQARKRLAALRPEAAAAAPPAVEEQTAEEEIEAAAEDVLLRLDPGMHTAVIWRLSVAADGRRLATASHDKTVKLWTLEGGDARLERTLRPPIGEGNEGKAYAVALSPDGAWAAVGGWSAGHVSHAERKGGPGACFVTIFDAATGSIVARLGPLPEVIFDLEFSPDGARLAAGLFGNNGVRVWDVTGLARGAGAGDLPLLFDDKDYGDSVYGLAYARDGRLAATSLDGHLRLYAPDGRRLAKAKAPSGARPFGIAFSPDGARLAVGYTDVARVDVLDAATLAQQPAPDCGGLSGGDLFSVAWLADGRLAAGGRAAGQRRDLLFVWAEGGAGARAAWPGPEITVMDVAPLPDGALAFTSGEPSFGVLAGDGRRRAFRGPPLADLRAKLGAHFTVSADGLRLRFGLKQWSGAPVLFDLAARTLVDAPRPAPGLAQPDITGLTINGWEDGFEPALTRKKGLFGGTETQRLALRQDETARSLAVAPDANSFVLGTEWLLRRFDAKGGEIWERPVPGVAWGVNLARSGKLILAAYGDGTIRWHKAEDGAELLALFIHLPQGPDGPREWVLFTPEGYYDASSEAAEKLIGWHVNRGEDVAADFYPVETFASTFNKREKIDAALADI